ncbi:MAG: ABC transporter permease [Acidipropionibacterium sp.]|jgi:ABC-2 type transport system permease protein|nr:ABC transporter permease [Acidipropionibacterium sp.]
MSSTTPDERTGSLWQIVTGREISAKLHDKAFITSTITTLLLVIVGFAVSILITGRSQTTTVAVLDDQGAAVVSAAQQIGKASGSNDTLEAVRAGSLEQATRQMDDGGADLLLQRSGDQWRLSGLKSAPSQTSTSTQALTQAVAATSIAGNAKALGVSPERLTAGTTLQLGTLGSAQDSEKQGAATVLGVVFAILFYLSMIIFGYAIANSVVEEKQSRIAEILLTAIPSRQLLLGKILGNTVLALGQMVLIVGVALAGLSFSPWKEYLSMVTAPALWFLVYFVVGFMALACLWAAAGALAGRSEDVSSTSMPLLMVVMAVYFYGMLANGSSQVIASYIPVASAIAMPTRLVTGAASWWEPIVSILVSLVFSAFTIWAGERIYRRAILQTGGKISLKSAWRNADVVR